MKAEGDPLKPGGGATPAATGTGRLTGRGVCLLRLGLTTAGTGWGAGAGALVRTWKTWLQ